MSETAQAASFQEFLEHSLSDFKSAALAAHRGALAASTEELAGERASLRDENARFREQLGLPLPAAGGQGTGHAYLHGGDKQEANRKAEETSDCYVSAANHRSTEADDTCSGFKKLSRVSEEEESVLGNTLGKLSTLGVVPNAQGSPKNQKKRHRPRMPATMPGRDEDDDASDVGDERVSTRFESMFQHQALEILDPAADAKAKIVRVTEGAGEASTTKDEKDASLSANNGSQSSASNQQDRFVLCACWIQAPRQRTQDDEAPESRLNRTKKVKLIRTQQLEDSDLADTDDLNHPVLSYLSSFMLHPGSFGRISWDMLGFVFVFYDGITIPLQFLDPGQAFMFSLIRWVARVFWTIDVALSFVTGYQRADGTVEYSPWKVAFRYFKGWFILDGLCISIDWMELFLENRSSGVSAGRGVAKSVRTMRVIRAVRLLRLVRLILLAPEVTGKFSFFVRSEEVMIICGVIKIIVMVSGLIHFIACCWYGIGKADSGWVQFYEYEEQNIGFRYAASYHWALTQFIGSADITPRNHSERAFAVVVLMLAFVTCGVVVSTITTSMTRLQIVTASTSKQIATLRRYLIENNISAALASRVQRNAKHVIAESKKNVHEDSVELLQLISMPLRIEIHFELYSPTLGIHPFFKAYRELNAPAYRQVCHEGITQQKLSKGDIVFTEGEVPQVAKMFWVMDGKLMYHKEGTRRSLFLEAECWADEVHLWVDGWVHHGQLRALADTDLMCLEAKAFQKTATQFRAKEFYPAKYAKVFVDNLNMAKSADINELNNEAVDAYEIANKVFCASLGLWSKAASTTGLGEGKGDHHDNHDHHDHGWSSFIPHGLGEGIHQLRNSMRNSRSSRRSGIHPPRSSVRSRHSCVETMDDPADIYHMHNIFDFPDDAGAEHQNVPKSSGGAKLSVPRESSPSNNGSKGRLFSVRAPPSPKGGFSQISPQEGVALGSQRSGHSMPPKLASKELSDW